MSDSESLNFPSELKNQNEDSKTNSKNKNGPSKRIQKKGKNLGLKTHQSGLKGPQDYKTKSQTKASTKKGPKSRPKPTNPQSSETFSMLSRGYKTQPCQFFLKGLCKKGEDCKYRHDIEQKPLSQLCKFHLTGGCSNKACLFLHDTTKYPCRYLYVTGRCDKGLECCFSHERFKGGKEEIDNYLRDNKRQAIEAVRRGIKTPLLEFGLQKGILREEEIWPERAQAQTKLINEELYNQFSEESEEESRGAENEEPKQLQGGQMSNAIGFSGSGSTYRESTPSDILFMP